ncbi:MAG TPA: hypothetical protein VEY13_05520, partial [Rubrobacteraceae bacterium]|nr:hypothetical protein [Rubrobacteraceae bacterium]
MTEGARQQDRGAGGMRSRTGAWLAWALAALSLAMFIASVALYLLARSAQEAYGTSGAADLRSVLFNVPFLTFPLVGALIASRRPNNPIGWICISVGFLWVFTFLSGGYIAYGIARPGSVPFVVITAALTQWMWVLPVGLLSTYLLLLFPDGKLPSSRWRPLGWLSGAVIVLMSATGLFTPGPLTEFEGVRNPLGLEGASWLVDASIVLLLVLAICSFASAVSLILRYRRSGGEVREQIKWIAFAASFVGLAFLGTILSVIIFAPEFFTPEGGGSTPPLWFGLLQYVIMLSFASVPVAMGFAVLKYRLYDIDLLINRTLVYGTLTATLALVYISSVVSLQAVLRVLTGQESTLAIVASTLAIAALFNPLRRRVQRLVDRRFYRRKYDAAKTLAAFNARLRDETDLDTLGRDLMGVVRDAIQPEHVSLWLR